MFRIDLNTFDLSQLPTAEDDYFEFKSSKTKPDEIKKKLSYAVSGFANSGGGCFIVGLDGNGNADGGIPLKIGNQDLRDWADNVINQVEPTPQYQIKIIQDPTGRGVIEPNNAVLIVAIALSHVAPHMAPDRCYYIRAGAHTVKAQHFIVEAIWAKRNFSQPRLTYLFRLKPGQEQIVQLGILALTDSPGLQVNITFSPFPQLLQKNAKNFPLLISVIDRLNPFFFDIGTFSQATELFGNNIELKISYSSLNNQSFNYNQIINIEGSLPTIVFPKKSYTEIAQSLNKIEKTLVTLLEPTENRIKNNFLVSKKFKKTKIKKVFNFLEKLIPELLNNLKNLLINEPCVREFIILSNQCSYNHNENNKIFELYYEHHFNLRNKLRILENYCLIMDITYNNTYRFVISEELAAYLMSRSSQVYKKTPSDKF